jgi:hypothetical protein
MARGNGRALTERACGLGHGLRAASLMTKALARRPGHDPREPALGQAIRRATTVPNG